MSHSTVVILNPVIGGARYASPHQARKWVRAGLAEWADQARYRIRLGPDLKVEMAGFHARPFRDAAIGYDGVFVLRSDQRPAMTLREMARIPIANPKKAMGFGRARRKRAAQA